MAIGASAGHHRRVVPGAADQPPRLDPGVADGRGEEVGEGRVGRDRPVVLGPVDPEVQPSPRGDPAGRVQEAGDGPVADRVLGVADVQAQGDRARHDVDGAGARRDRPDGPPEALDRPGQAPRPPGPARPRPAGRRGGGPSARSRRGRPAPRT